MTLSRAGEAAAADEVAQAFTQAEDFTVAVAEQFMQDAAHTQDVARTRDASRARSIPSQVGRAIAPARATRDGTIPIEDMDMGLLRREPLR